MSEKVVTAYKRLFEVRVLHHYWLDEGQVVFDTLSAEKQVQRLSNYDWRSFLKVTPAASTQKLLLEMKAVQKDTSLGWLVAVPDEAVIADTSRFEFYLSVINASFYQYTALTLTKQEISEAYNTVTGQVTRYKSNVSILSNLTGVTRGAGPATTYYLSREIPAPGANDKAESLVVSAGALQQLTADQPGASVQQLAALASNLPVFLHQGDVPVIVPPAGLTGVPDKGIELTEEIPDAVFALVRIVAVRPGNIDFSCTSGGKAKVNAPVFQIRFKNRSTIQKYYKKSTGDFKSMETSPLPLTKYGFAGTHAKPIPEGVKFTLLSSRVTEIFTEIFE